VDWGISGELVRVYTTHSITDGYLARGRLEADDIPVVLKGNGEGPYRMGPVQLWVPAELEVQARMLLDEISAGVWRTEEGKEVFPETDWTQAESAPPVD
jgi:Putative prokaryotic signal transducing protein